MKPISFALALLAGLVFGQAAQAQARADAREPGSSCGAPFNSYGPFDYRTAQPSQKSIVERAHFTPVVESLKRGQTSGDAPGHDIQYTIAVFPNHPRALLAMDRLAEKEGQDPPKRGILRVECWYERALRWRSDDHVVRMLYADFLIRRKRANEALAHLDYVVERADDNPFTYYNAGLIYLKAEAFDKALAQAHRAQALGFPRTELMEGLKAANRWQEPAPETPQPAASKAASSP